MGKLEGPIPGERPLLCQVSGPVARLTLNRPAQRNALSADLLECLDGALVELAADRSVRAIVLAAAGPAFSAGHDLNEVRGASPQHAEELLDVCARVMRRIHETPQPVVARVHGVATAAGCQLVAACDLAVASESATFATPGVKIGLFCSTPAVPLVRAVGRKRALEMLLGGSPIDARTALDWGLVNRVVRDPDLDGAVQALLEPILAASAHAVALGKRTFYLQVELPEAEAYCVASAAMCENAAAEDAREGMEAFLEKRRPTWRHR